MVRMGRKPMQRTLLEPFSKGSWRQEIYARLYPKLQTEPITTTDIREAWVDVIRDRDLGGRFVLDVRVRDFVNAGIRLGLLERVSRGQYKLGPLLTAVWLEELRDLCLGEYGLDPEDWDDFQAEWDSNAPVERWKEPAGGYRARQCFTDGKTPKETAEILANEEYWPHASPAVNDGPPYDAATATGMYDRTDG